ncbi:MAG: SIS domain-containing protein, partial [Clostridia bacterium]|nr:SIS domain-containing protein [Clostridia bacterium]
HGLKTLAVTNVKNSSISRVCDFVLYTHAGKEVAVASTKAFNCQVAVLYLFASYLKSLKEDVDYVEEESTRLLEVSNQIEGLEIDGQCQEIANLIGGEKSIYMIGRGLDYLLAKESALKLKEITYIHCEAFPAGELKHGTISLIEEGTIVFAFATCKQTLPKMLSSIKEVQSRGARVILLTQFDDIQEAFLTIKLKSLPEKYMPLYAVVYMQKIAYYTSTALGNNPDKPRSLAKSVTVE